MAHSLNRQWFVPGDGIAREVITADIQRYLGPDATVRPGTGTGQDEGADGFWITAYRTLTSQMIQDLKQDSQRWRAEIANGRGSLSGSSGGKSSKSSDAVLVAYQDSQTHQSRQYYGPTTPAPPPAGYPAGAPAQGYSQAYANYTHQQPSQRYAQPAAQYVPAPGYGQEQVRTAPNYTYPNQSPGSHASSHGDYYAQQTPDPRYGAYQQHSQPAPRQQDPYAQPPSSHAQQYGYAQQDRAYQQQPPPQANDSRRRR